MKTTTDCIEINPPTKEIGTVIWLHGLGADGNDFAPIVPALNLPNHLPLRFIFPHAPMRPITINNGYVMRAWYDIINLTLDQRADEQGVGESVQFVEQLIAHEVKRGTPVNKIVLAGFSQGAAIALSTGLTHKTSLAGIMALSGYLPLAEKVLANANPTNFTTPIFLAHGTDDNVIPYFVGEQLCALLEKNKYQVDWHGYTMPHSVCQEEVGDIAAWLQRIYQA